MWEITLRDVMLNWAFSECLSPKWRERYEHYMPQTSLEKIKPGSTRFDRHTLSTEEQDLFIERLRSYRHPLLDEYLIHTNTYRIRSCNKDAVNGFGVIREMHWQDRPVSLLEFSGMPYDSEFTGHPCAVAERICEENTLSFSGMPIIVINKEHENGVLVEGYSRCLAFLKKAARQDFLWAFICE